MSFFANDPKIKWSKDTERPFIRNKKCEVIQ